MAFVAGRDEVDCSAFGRAGRRRPALRWRWLLAVVMVLGGRGALAQELEPRAFQSLPVGLRFLVTSVQRSAGNVVFDVTMPVENLHVETWVTDLSYLGTFSLAGHSASLGFSAPRVQGSGSARLGEETITRSRDGWADPRLRLSVSLVGGPALHAAEFSRSRPRRTWGASLTVALPLGQYNPDYLVNYGTNRWGFKPETGYSSVHGPWTLETSVGIWLFTDNTAGPGGATVRQDPIASWQGHVSYQFASRIWISLDLNYFHGGEIRVEGREPSELQSNSRLGGTFSFPIAGRQSLKLALATGAYTRAGADFNVAMASYQVRWGAAGRKR